MESLIELLVAPLSSTDQPEAKAIISSLVSKFEKLCYCGSFEFK